jgi:hypothetical protein
MSTRELAIRYVNHFSCIGMPKKENLETAGTAWMYWMREAKMTAPGPEKLKFREGKSAIVENCMMEAMRAAKKVRPAYLWDPILLSMTLNC